MRNIRPVITNPIDRSFKSVIKKLKVMKANKLLMLSKAGISAVTLFLTLNSMDAKAQPANEPDGNQVAARLIRYEVKPEFQTVLSKAITGYVLHSLNRENNILSEAYYEEDKPSILWIIERWSNKAALNKSSSSSRFKAISSLSKNGLTKPAEIFYIKDLEPLSKKQWRSTAKKDDKPITIMLFVDSKAGTEDEFQNVYHTAMPLFRSEPGVINYQLSQFEGDSTRFVTYEKFRNEDAFQYHLNFPPIKPVIDYLNTSIKKQPFQTGLHRLIAFTPFTPE
jgi:quinol monooxygenase YgiN